MGPTYRLPAGFVVPALHRDALAELANAANAANAWPPLPALSGRPRVAVIRQEGSNGDREMLSAFFAAGCEAWDVNMTDLLGGAITVRPLLLCSSVAL